MAKKAKISIQSSKEKPSGHSNKFNKNSPGKNQAKKGPKLNDKSKAINKNGKKNNIQNKNQAKKAIASTEVSYVNKKFDKKKKKENGMETASAVKISNVATVLPEVSSDHNNKKKKSKKNKIVNDEPAEATVVEAPTKKGIVLENGTAAADSTKKVKKDKKNKNLVENSSGNVDVPSQESTEVVKKVKKDKKKKNAEDGNVLTEKLETVEIKKKDKKKIKSPAENGTEENGLKTKKNKKSKKSATSEEDDSSDSDDENMTELSEDDAKNQKLDAKTAKIPLTKEEKIKENEYSVFVGNLPPLIKKQKISSRFKEFGTIRSIRLRTDDGAVIFSKRALKTMKSISCYVRFSDKEAAEKACVVNGEMLEGNRIRVMPADQKPRGHTASTVFVGNISYKTTDNELYEFFDKVGEIEYVRQFSFKGIGYVCFKKGVAIAKALKLNNHELGGRKLRVLKIDTQKQPKKKVNKKGNIVNKTKVNNDSASSKATNKKTNTNFLGATTEDKKRTKKKSKLGTAARTKKIFAKKLKAAATPKKVT